MQLTKDDLVKTVQASGFTAYNGAIYSHENNVTKLLEGFAAAVIAAHTAKVLEDVQAVAVVEPVNTGGDVEAVLLRPTPVETLLYPAHTVAALKSRADALAARVAELEKDAARLDYIEENARCDPKMDGRHVWWPTTFSNQLKGANLREAIDAALAAKGQA